MITIYIVFFISLWIYGCRSECTKENPFFMIDKQCANFNDVCVKKDYGPCKSLLQACAQCPISNLTESALVNMLMILRDQQNKTTEANYKTFEARLNKSEREILEKLALVEKRSSSSNFMVIIIIAIFFIGFLVILLVILLFILLILKKMRWQPFKLCCRNPGASRNYEAIPFKTIPRSDETIHQTLENIENQIKTITKTLSVTVSINMRGFTNSMKVQINREDNVVKVKQKICAQMTNTKSDYFKMMVLKLNGSLLNDNQYLADKICSVDDSLHCDVIEDFDPSDRVVVMLRGNICLPEMIQINKSQPIEWLKSFLSELTGVDTDSLKLFRNSNEIDKLDDLHDYESLCIIEIRKGDLIIESIFDNIKKWLLSYSNMESVGNIKNKIAEDIKCHAENVILFCDNKNLNDDNIFLFETVIEQGRQLKFCHLIPADKLKIIKSGMNGYYSEIFEGQNPSTSKKVVFKKYSLEPMKILKENKAFLNELETFQITKSHGGFVPLNGVFIEKDYFYIMMEKMEGSIKEFIKNNHPLSEEIIAEWAKQILSALKCLHDNGIIHRDIKPSSILLDKNENIKLSSFGIAKYFNWEERNLCKWGFESRTGTFRYMAPEACSSKNYGPEIDVWSFGAIMIEMATGKQPFDGKDEQKAVMEIGTNKKIPYELDHTRSLEIKTFIDRCLIEEAKNRATVDDLLKHVFLNPK